MTRWFCSQIFLVLLKHKALLAFFLCIFSSLTCLKKRVFSQQGSSVVKGTSQPVTISKK
jgi:hypothetical protein